MNQRIPSVCAAALLACGIGAQGACVVTCRQKVTVYTEPCYKPLKVACCYDAFREPYRISYPRLRRCPGEYVEIGNTPGALAMRQAAVLRQREIIRFEKGLMAASTPITQPSSTGTTMFGETEGAGVFDNPCAPIPPAPPYPGPSAPRGVVPPPPVAEYRDPAPVAVPVPGKPGCVYSPFARNAGFVDVNGLAPGSMAKCPFSGRAFRVP